MNKTIEGLKDFIEIFSTLEEQLRLLRLLGPLPKNDSQHGHFTECKSYIHLAAREAHFLVQEYVSELDDDVYHTIYGESNRYFFINKLKEVFKDELFKDE